jgi:Trp operon repressor
MPQPTLPDDLLNVVAALDEPTDVDLLLRDLLTPHERESLAERWAIVKALAGGATQRDVRDTLGCSITTVSRGNKQLKYGDGGLALAFAAMARLGHDDPRGVR